MSFFSNYTFSVSERFLRYVSIDTQSDPASPTCPSTEKQKDLGRLLVSELNDLGIADAELDANGYVYATVPANSEKQVPVICFCSHMDTSPDCNGAQVKPIVHRKYSGKDIVLPDDPSVVIRMKDHPGLMAQIGNDLVTASGLTLLGADNKAGVAEIMDAVNFLLSHPEIKHGKISILFTPDEEIGRGVDRVDLKRVGADFAYTVDGEELGSLENETFSADGATLTVKGVSAHPGFAKGCMESAIRILSDILSRLPKDRLSPESASGREGFIHPVSFGGSVEEATAGFILRDFDTEKLGAHGAVLDAIAADVLRGYPGSSYTLEIREQYRNMKQVLDRYPQVTELAIKAMERSGLSPRLQSIRGGTDGSRLSFMGLPCPNIFAGEHAFHSKQEWVSVQDMQKAVETIVNLCIVWEEAV
jgi:tripeptide aminopeptidase